MAPPRLAYPRRKRPSLIGRFRVAVEAPLAMPEPLRGSDFGSDQGATTTVAMYGVGPYMVADRFAQDPDDRAEARPRARLMGLTVPAPTPQTVSNRRRAELAAGVPPGVLEILEGVGE